MIVCRICKYSLTLSMDLENHPILITGHSGSRNINSKLAQVCLLTGSENVAKKMNLRSFKLNRLHLDPLRSNAGNFSWS